MTFYKIDFKHEEKEVGTFPQSNGMVAGYPYGRVDSVWHIGKNPSVPPNLQSILLQKGARLTDLLSIGVINQYHGLIVSERFKTLLCDFSLPEHHFYRAKVIRSDDLATEVGHYYLFVTTKQANDHIDYAASRFIVKGLGGITIRYLSISRAQDLEIGSQLGPGETLSAEMVVLDKDFVWDIFRIDRVSGFLVSERLKNAIEKTQLTGIALTPAPAIVLGRQVDQL